MQSFLNTLVCIYDVYKLSEYSTGKSTPTRNSGIGDGGENIFFDFFSLLNADLVFYLQKSCTIVGQIYMSSNIF